MSRNKLMSELLSVKSEDGTEDTQLSELHHIKAKDKKEKEAPASSSAEQMEAEHDGKDCGGPEPEKKTDPDTHVQANTGKNVSDSFENEVKDDDDDDDSYDDDNDDN
ncbi:hypothetical protein AMECASPLE_024155 [Ameca splendens]|uniref:Uncharacterized protein n=1 Tax=Ameca splendens TaxID=208324 RepID=A0ABV0Z3X7_9TELE